MAIGGLQRQPRRRKKVRRRAATLDAVARALHRQGAASCSPGEVLRIEQIHVSQVRRLHCFQPARLPGIHAHRPPHRRSPGMHRAKDFHVVGAPRSAPMMYLLDDNRACTTVSFSHPPALQSYLYESRLLHPLAQSTTPPRHPCRGAARIRLERRRRAAPSICSWRTGMGADGGLTSTAPERSKPPGTTSSCCADGRCSPSPTCARRKSFAPHFFRDQRCGCRCSGDEKKRSRCHCSPVACRAAHAGRIQQRQIKAYRDLRREFGYVAEFYQRAIAVRDVPGRARCRQGPRCSVRQISWLLWLRRSRRVASTSLQLVGRVTFSQRGAHPCRGRRTSSCVRARLPFQRSRAERTPPFPESGRTRPAMLIATL